MHTSTSAAKTLVRAYYGKPASYSYFDGCSTGGREGLMEAQRYPGDFDGIVAGAPVLHYQELNAGHTWLLQRTFRNDFAGNLAYSTKATQLRQHEETAAARGHGDGSSAIRSTASRTA